jgi:hypothetical protein
MLIKTEARGFYLDSGDEKLSGYGDFSKKSTEIGSVPSSQQLPFLIYQQTSADDSFRRQYEPGNSSKEGREGKKKSQLLVHRQTFNIKQHTTSKQ